MWSSSIFCVPSTWMLIGTCCMFSVRFSAVTTTVSMPPLSAANATVVSAVDASNVERNTPRAVPIPLMKIPSKKNTARGHVMPPSHTCQGERFRNCERVGIPQHRITPSSSPGLCGRPMDAISLVAVGRPHKAGDDDFLFLNHIRIRLDRVPQRVLQLPQPRLEPAPLLDAVGEDRLAHLFGTGGAHRALGLVEAQALLLERQSAMVEQAADLA